MAQALKVGIFATIYLTPLFLAEVGVARIVTSSV